MAGGDDDTASGATIAERPSAKLLIGEPPSEPAAPPTIHDPAPPTIHDPAPPTAEPAAETATATATTAMHDEEI